jgi:hypothetical protein
MKRLSPFAVLFVVLLLCSGCLAPVKNEIPLAGSDLSIKTAGTNETKLVVFNDSNFLLYGLDGSGRVNVRLDGKGVAQLKVGYYAQVIVPRGNHEVGLLHVDRDYYSTQHEIELTEPEAYLEVRALGFSNEARLVSALPPDFEKKFKPVK